MLLSASPVLGGFYVILLFLLSYFSVYAGKSFSLLWKRQAPPPKSEPTVKPQIYVLEKKAAPKRKSPAKKRKPKRELYYLSTLEKETEAE